MIQTYPSLQNCTLWGYIITIQNKTTECNVSVVSSVSDYLFNYLLLIIAFNNTKQENDKKKKGILLWLTSQCCWLFK